MKDEKTSEKITHETKEAVKEGSMESRKDDRRARGRILGGTLIILVGIGLLMQNIFPWFNFNYVWPVLIIVIGISIMMRGVK